MLQTKKDVLSQATLQGAALRLSRAGDWGPAADSVSQLTLYFLQETQIVTYVEDALVDTHI